MQEVDSDDEWRSLIEATSVKSSRQDAILNVVGDPTFLSKLKTGLESSKAQVLDGALDGAARLKRVLEIIVNVESIKGCVF